MWTEGQPTLSLCISNKMEACWALYNRFLPPLHLCLSMMVNHSLGRKPNVLFMPSFELKCFSPCYINIYITPSNTVIDSVRSLGTLSLLQWEGNCHAGNSSRGWGAAPSVHRHSPRPVPIPAAALGTSQGSKELYKCCPHRGALQDKPAWLSCGLSPLTPSLCCMHRAAKGPAPATAQQVLQGTQRATSTRMLRESRDRAPGDFRKNMNELRSKFNKNFITFCFHELMLGKQLSWGLSWTKRYWAQPSNESTSAFHPANTTHVTFALSEVWL